MPGAGVPSGASAGALDDVPDVRQAHRVELVRGGRRIGDDDPGHERRKGLVGTKRELERIDAGAGDVEVRLRQRTAQTEREVHRALRVAGQAAHREGERVDPVAEPVAVDRVVEGFGGGDRGVGAQPELHVFPGGQERRRDVEPQRDVTAFGDPRVL